MLFGCAHTDEWLSVASVLFCSMLVRIKWGPTSESMQVVQNLEGSCKARIWFFPLLLKLLSQSKSRSVNNFKLYLLDSTSTLFENSLKPNMVKLERVLLMGRPPEWYVLQLNSLCWSVRLLLFKKALWRLFAYMYTCVLLCVPNAGTGPRHAQEPLWDYLMQVVGSK